MRRGERILHGRGLVPGLAAAAALLGLALSPLALAGRSQAGPPTHAAADPSRLTLLSPDIAAGARIARSHVYDRSGCQGGNISPALSWSHPPAGTRSFAVLMFDPDAPGEGWWHWAVFDIPSSVSALAAGAGDPASPRLPAGAIQVRNDFGSRGYGGPCPPPGQAHHYRLMLYALRIARLGLGPGAAAAAVAAKARANALAEAEIVAIYGR